MVKYRVEYFVIGKGREPNIVLTITTDRSGTMEQIADVLDQLKNTLREEKLKIDDIIIYKLIREAA